MEKLESSISIPNTSEPKFLFIWNRGGDSQITQIHTWGTLKKEYGDTNLFDDPDPLLDLEKDSGRWMTFQQAMASAMRDNFQDWCFDNMEFRRIT